ncbi:hypothetical protein IAU60_003616 [Kwoniella sp. DSM 27419]
MAPGRMVTSSRRAGRVTNKTKLVIYKGTDKVDLGAAETIVWESDPSGSGGASSEQKSQHVGAKGVESGELLEHHLQAALSSASLLHSRAQSNKPDSPSNKQSAKPEFTATSSLNYHIPTPDASGVVDNNAFVPLYQATRYVEPVNYIRFSDTVEESSGGWGGLGYCMDDRDVKWLSEFNAKAEGSSGANGDVKPSPQTPIKDGQGGNTPASGGRGMRVKGKEKEKDKGDGVPTHLFIGEDTFEYIMGVLEKYAEDSVPMLHTNLSLLPAFSSIEPMFSSPIPASFLPSNEIPKDLPELKALARMARNVYPHWKLRREERQGKPVLPALNYDETNDNDPYVCFRRRDIRATRKTRRTDNHSIEQFQKLQSELRSAHNLATMVVRRENEKRALFKADKDVWEAKWKLFEVKRRWPSLGMTREEEEIITGRPMSGVVPITLPAMAGSQPLHPSQTNIPSMRKKAQEKDRDEREKRERAIEAARAADKTGGAFSGRSNAPEAIKERILALQQKLDEIMAKKKEADSHWDDCTDSSYQPLPVTQSQYAFRPVTSLDPHHAHAYHRGKDDSDDDNEEPLYPSSFRMRRGRGGLIRLDRRAPVFPNRRGGPPTTPSDYPDWLFPDTTPRSTVRRPKSIDEVEDELPIAADPDDHSEKRRKLNEIWRYDVSKGGALGVGMGVVEDQDRVIIDDMDQKYIRNRISLLQEDDWNRLKPDMSVVEQAMAAIDAPFELPPTPVFVRPQIVPPNPQVVAAHLQQQQLLQQQQQMEQFQRFQLLAQQQALQQQAAIAAQAQAQGGVPNANQSRAASADGSANGTAAAASPVINGTQVPPGMQAPNGVTGQAGPNGRPQVVKRPSQMGQSPMGPPSQLRPSASISPSNAAHGNPALNGQAAQPVNGALPNGKHANGAVNGVATPGATNGPGAVNMTSAMQQSLLARAFAAQQQAIPNLETMPAEQLHELQRLAGQAGYGDNIQTFLEARNKAAIIRMAKLAEHQQFRQVHHQQPQAQVHAQAQAQGQGQALQNATVNATGQGQVPGAGVQAQGQGANQTQGQQPQNGQQPFSPAMPNGGLQLKLPAHAAARLGASQNGQAPPAQRA